MSVTVRKLNHVRPFKQRDDEFTWEDGEFVDTDGEPVDRKKLLLLVLLLMQFGRASARTASEDLIAGEITIDQWAIRMSTMVRSLMISQGVLAYGGAANLTPERLAIIEELINNQQTQYLDKFVESIRRGDIEIGPAIISRSELYALPGWPAYAKLERQREIADGIGFERRILGDSVESCPDCIDYADQGWVEAGTLPDIGQESQCSYGCRCEFLYSSTLPHGEDSEDNL